LLLLFFDLLTAELPGLVADFLGVVEEPPVRFLTLAIAEIEINYYVQSITVRLRRREMEYKVPVSDR
jgi:hypothetical protein